MIACGSLEFTHARVMARHGQRAAEAVWQRLAVTRELAALLEAARASPLRSWVDGLSAGSGPAQIESELRRHWRGTVMEVAAWMPPPWQTALLWCKEWPELPVLQHLAQGGEPLAWMQDDPDYRALSALTPTDRSPHALTGTRFAALASAWSQPQTLPRAWHAEWRRRLPCGADECLHPLVQTLQTHGTAFAAAPPGPGGHLRRALQARLTLLLRRAALEPAVAFIHVALCALDLERLRGELLERALFAHGRSS